MQATPSSAHAAVGLPSSTALLQRNPSASRLVSLLQHPRAAFLGRVAAWYACWLLFKAMAKQPCVAFLLQYWSLQSPRRLLGRPASAQALRAKKQLQLLLFAFI